MTVHLPRDATIRTADVPAWERLPAGVAPPAPARLPLSCFLPLGSPARDVWADRRRGVCPVVWLLSPTSCFPGSATKLSVCASWLISMAS